MDFMKPFGCNCSSSCNMHSNPAPTCRQTAAEHCHKFDTYDTLHDMPLAMAYVPWQEWKNVYDASTGLQKGTVFEDLIFPFLYANPACRECGCNTGRSCGQR